MERTRIIACLVFLLFAARAAAAPPDTSRIPAAEPSSAVLALSFQLSIATPLPAGVTLVCRARMVPSFPAGDPRNTQPAATRSATGSQCALEIPYSWSGDAVPAVSLEYEIDAVSSAGIVVQTLVRNTIELATPPRGEVVRVNLQP
jgi:hypothetical protein